MSLGIVQREKSGLLILFLAALALGVWLRFDGLGEKPMHADEATGARLLANYLESGDYRFDPEHFHGPAQSLLAAPIARAFGQTGWNALEPGTLRLLPALAGVLVLFTPLLFHRFLGSSGTLAAVLLLGTSPLLVYYNRMFIHETLFALASLVCIAAINRYRQHPGFATACLLGLGVGAMAVVRETFAVFVIAWSCAVALSLWEQRAWLAIRRGWRLYLAHASVAVFASLLCIGLLYTDFLQSPTGFIDFFRTFFVYEVTAGHEKPFGYYSGLLLLPEYSIGRWWTEGGLFLLLLIGYIATWLPRLSSAAFGSGHGALVRCLVYAVLGQWIIYSFIGYKTPWLMVSVWAQALLAAACGVRVLFVRAGGRTLQTVSVMGLLLLLAGFQFTRSIDAAHRFHSDGRNPYAYVPTSPDVVRLEAWLGTLAEAQPALHQHPVYVLGRQYWPLPWYLREFGSVGYVDALPEDAHRLPLILAVLVPGAPSFDALLESHEVFYRGLRHEVMVAVLVRKDLWREHLSNRTGSEDSQ